MTKRLRSDEDAIIEFTDRQHLKQPSGYICRSAHLQNCPHNKGRGLRYASYWDAENRRYLPRFCHAPRFMERPYLVGRNEHTELVIGRSGNSTLYPGWMHYPEPYDREDFFMGHYLCTDCYMAHIEYIIGHYDTTTPQPLRTLGPDDLSDNIWQEVIEPVINTWMYNLFEDLYFPKYVTDAKGSVYWTPPHGGEAIWVAGTP